MVAVVKERLAVTKQRSQRFYMERFNLKKLNKVESREIPMWRQVRITPP
jgi:hypothetical protein